jgi:pyridoxamine 5'-phosphate oxidase
MTLTLPEFADPPADPVALLRNWLGEAEAAGVREARTATFSTADAGGRVSARTVLIKELADHGLLIGFSERSRKGRDIVGNPHAAVTFYWRERAQQIVICGRIDKAPDAVSDRIFLTRPPSARALATVSAQSQPTTALRALRQAVAEAEQTEDLRRPASWSAWLLHYDELEFWHGSPDRFHRRLYYRRVGDHFVSSRLQP